MFLKLRRISLQSFAISRSFLTLSRPTANELSLEDAKLTNYCKPLRLTCAASIPVFRVNQIRCKTSKKGAKTVEDDDDEDDFEDDEYDGPGSKVVTGYMSSLRADLVLKTGLGMSRNKIETIFYESKVRVNGEKLKKKSQKVFVGDELDVIKGPSPINEEFLIVSRVVVLHAKVHEDGERVVVKMRRFKSLSIENNEY